MKDERVFESNLFGMILLILYVATPSVIIEFLKDVKLPVYYSIVLSQMILLFIPTIIYFIVKRRSVKETLRLKKIGFKTIIIIIGIGFLSQPIANFLSFITQFIFPNRIGQVVEKLNSIPLIVRLGAIALTPAIFEEITMRGVILGGYDNVSMKKTALMTGLFFAMIHMDGNQSLYTFVLGIIFAYLVRITGSIYSSMICHFTINGSQVILANIFLKHSKSATDLSQSTILSSLPKGQLIVMFFQLVIVASICLGIIIFLMKKLIKIHGTGGLEGINVERNHVKVMNWPVYVSLIIYSIIIMDDILTRF